MWAQTWSGIMDLVIPYPDATQVDATPAMVAQVNEHQIRAHTVEDYLFIYYFFYLRNGTPPECSRSQTGFSRRLVWNPCLKSFGTNRCWRSLLMGVRWCATPQHGTFITEKISGKSTAVAMTTCTTKKVFLSAYWKDAARMHKIWHEQTGLGRSGRIQRPHRGKNEWKCCLY